MTREQLIKHWDVIKAFKEGKEIQCRVKGSKEWRNDNGYGFDFVNGYEYREKPEQQKRLPTIEEVEKWFLENRVFKLKLQSNGLYRMETICIEAKALRIGGRNILIDEFCEDFTHYDGSELYITED